MFFSTPLGQLASLFPLLLISTSVEARPVVPRQSSISLLSTDDTLSTFLRPAQFARLAYCDKENVQALNCGEPCKDIPDADVEILKVGGGDGSFPLFVIAHDRPSNTIFVSHQGTDSQDLESILNDLEILLVPINEERFPSTAGKNVKVHDGFYESFEQSADEVLEGVKSALEATNSTSVVATGHSLGGSIAMLDSLMLKDALDPSISLKTVSFGLPRTGNQDFADWVDDMLGDNQTFMTNKNDPVPQLPPSLLFYQHPSGEVHISESNEFVACAGQENEDPSCSRGDSATGGFLGLLPDVSIDNHRGPYVNDIRFGQRFCPKV